MRIEPSVATAAVESQRAAVIAPAGPFPQATCAECAASPATPLLPGPASLPALARPEPTGGAAVTFDELAFVLGDPEALKPQPATLEATWLETMARSVAMARDMLSVAGPALVLAIVVHLFLAQATVVYGQSMEPNLSPRQRLIIEKFSYRLRAPQRNDIVVVDLPQLDDMLVKRIVGLPGETIAVRAGLVYVNGAPLLEPFAHEVDRASLAPLRLGADEYFVLGDNRDNSNDSRYFGPVARDRILGKVWLRYWPLHRARLF